MATDKKDLWVQWTHDAMLKYTPPDGKIDNDELIDDMSEIAAGYADQMLDEFEERFGGGGGGGRSRKRKKEEPEDD